MRSSMAWTLSREQLVAGMDGARDRVSERHSWRTLEMLARAALGRRRRAISCAVPRGRARRARANRASGPGRCRKPFADYRVLCLCGARRRSARIGIQSGRRVRSRRERVRKLRCGRDALRLRSMIAPSRSRESTASSTCSSSATSCVRGLPASRDRVTSRCSGEPVCSEQVLHGRSRLAGR
jgi:hypothetical protein